MKNNKIRFFTLLTLAFLLVQTTSVQASPDNRPAFADGTNLYVATSGSDSNDCLTISTPCQTINGAIEKAVDEDTIYVAIGTYTSTEDNVVYINKGITLLGGWNANFTDQTGHSTIDGQKARRGVLIAIPCCAIPGYPPVVIDHLKVQNSASVGAFVGGGVVIYSAGVVTISNGVISENTSTTSGGGISTQAEELIINNTTISNNTSGRLYVSGGGGGAGISITYGKVTLNNSSIVNNNMLVFLMVVEFTIPAKTN